MSLPQWWFGQFTVNFITFPGKSIEHNSCFSTTQNERTEYQHCWRNQEILNYINFLNSEFTSISPLLVNSLNFWIECFWTQWRKKEEMITFLYLALLLLSGCLEKAEPLPHSLPVIWTLICVCLCKIVNKQEDCHCPWPAVIWWEISCGGSGGYFPGSDGCSWVVNEVISVKFAYSGAPIQTARHHNASPSVTHNDCVPLEHWSFSFSLPVRPLASSPHNCWLHPMA